MPEAPSLEDQPINDDAPEAPELSDQPSGDEDSLPEFDYSGIPDDQRETVEGRIKGFQAKFTQAQQGLAETRREAEHNAQVLEALRSGNPDVRRALLGQLGLDEQAVLGMFGYELPEQEEFDDPDDQLRHEVQELRQERETEKQARDRETQEEAVTDYIAGELEALENKVGVEFDAEDHKVLDALSRQFPKDVGGRLVPDIEGAYALFSGATKRGNKRLLSGKENVPRRPGGGNAGSRTVDLSKETPEQRRERMAGAVDAHSASGA